MTTARYKELELKAQARVGNTVTQIGITGFWYWQSPTHVVPRFQRWAEQTIRANQRNERAEAGVKLVNEHVVEDAREEKLADE